MSVKKRRTVFIWLPISITIIFINALFILSWFGQTNTPTIAPINIPFNTSNTPQNNISSPIHIHMDPFNHNENTLKLQHWNSSCLHHKRLICVLPLFHKNNTINFTVVPPPHGGNDAMIYSIKFNNDTDISYIMKYKENCDINTFYQEYKVMNQLYKYNNTLNVAWLHKQLPFYYYKNNLNITCFFFMDKLKHTYPFRKLQRIARFENVSTIKTLLTSFDEIDGGIVQFLMKCFNTILPILKTLIEFNIYNDDINSRNILIDKYTHKCYLIDFGLTRNLTQQSLYKNNITVYSDIFTCLHYSCSPYLLQYKRNFNDYNLIQNQKQIKLIAYNSLKYQLWSMFFHFFVSSYTHIILSNDLRDKLEWLNYRFNLGDNNNFHRTNLHFKRSFCQRYTIILLLKQYTNNLNDIYINQYDIETFWDIMKIFDNDLMQIPKEKRNNCIPELDDFDPYYLPKTSNNKVSHLKFNKYKYKYQLPNIFQKCVRKILKENSTQICMLPNNISFSTNKIIGIGNHAVVYDVNINGNINYNDKYVLKFENKWCVQLLNEYEWTYEFQNYLQENNYNLNDFHMSLIHSEIPFYSFYINEIKEYNGCFVFIKQIENTIPLHMLLNQNSDNKSIEMVNEIIGDNIITFLINCYNDIINIFDKMYEFDKSFHNSLHIGNILVNIMDHKCYLIDFGSLWYDYKKKYEYSCFLYSCSPFTFYYLQTIEKRNLFRKQYIENNPNITKMRHSKQNNIIDMELNKYAMYGKRYEMISIIFHIFVEYYCVRNHHKVCGRLMKFNHRIPLIYDKKSNYNETEFIQRWHDRYKMIKFLRKKQYKYNISVTAEFWNLLNIFENDFSFIY